MVLEDPTHPFKVLVTGGGGFVGSHIIRALHREQTPCTIYSMSRNPGGQPITDNEVLYEAADITNLDQLQRVFQRVQPQVVFHVASPSPLEAAKTLYNTNVTGTSNLLAACKECPETKAFVYTSSDSAVMPTDGMITEDESRLYTAEDEIYPYHKSKALGEALVIAANGENLRTCAIRLPVVYGEYDYRNFALSLVRALQRNEHTMQIGADKKMFEFIYVGKAAEAHVLAAKALLREAAGEVESPEMKRAGEAFFISDGRPCPMFEFSRKCFAAAGKPVKQQDVKKIPLMVVQIMASVGEWVFFLFTAGTVRPRMRRQDIDHLDRGCHWNLAKAKKRLGYEPVQNQEDAIERTMAWAMANLK